MATSAVYTQRHKAIVPRPAAAPGLSLREAPRPRAPRAKHVRPEQSSSRAPSQAQPGRRAKWSTAISDGRRRTGPGGTHLLALDAALAALADARTPADHALARGPAASQCRRPGLRLAETVA